MENLDLTLYAGAGFATVFTVKNSETNLPIPLTGYDIILTFYEPDGTIITHYDVPSTQLALGSDVGKVNLTLSIAEVSALTDGTFTLIINDGTVPILASTGNVLFVRKFTSNIEYLIPYLRLKLGDINPETYRYLDEWLLKSLILGMKTLQRYWTFKYLIDENNIVTRNPVCTTFALPEPPIIEPADEYVIVLMATIITLEGSLENNAWNTVSWSDAEIRYTNIDGGRIREGNLKRLIDELNSLVLSPNKRLAKTKKSSLPGYKGNDYEYNND